MHTITHVQQQSRRILLATAIAVTIATTALVTNRAEAGTDSESEFHFVYKRGDLRNPEAVTNFYRKLDYAVRRYCEIPGARAASDKRAERECRETTLSSAVASIGNDQLTALYRKRTGDSRIAARL